MSAKSMTFEQWMASVDDKIGCVLFGMTSGDLPDVCYRDWYEEGLNPQRAAVQAIRSARDGE